jgi:hypothetical protein
MSCLNKNVITKKLTGEKYGRQNNFPQKTFYFKRIFSFPRKSADPRPIPIPENTAIM